MGATGDGQCRRGARRQIRQKLRLDKPSAPGRREDNIAQPSKAFRAALVSCVALGGAPFGWSNQTDAVGGSRRERSSWTFRRYPPRSSTLPLTNTPHPDAHPSCLSYIRSPAARPAFERQGFITVLVRAATLLTNWVAAPDEQTTCMICSIHAGCNGPRFGSASRRDPLPLGRELARWESRSPT